jgi:hypothetical protein
VSISQRNGPRVAEVAGVNDTVRFGSLASLRRAVGRNSTQIAFDLWLTVCYNYPGGFTKRLFESSETA